jgi:hypothetical protein
VAGGERLHRRIGNQSFASPVNKCIRHSEITIRDFSIKQIVCGPPWRTGGRSKAHRRTSISGIGKSVFP